MPRPATPRPPGEHVVLIARVLRQIEADKGMQKARARRVKNHLRKALGELTSEMGRR